MFCGVNNCWLNTIEVGDIVASSKFELFNTSASAVFTDNSFVSSSLRFLSLTLYFNHKLVSTYFTQY